MAATISHLYATAVRELGVETLEMGLLANFKIRTKIFVALLPLAFMVIVAALYASIQMNRIDTRYSELIGNDVKALHNLTVARVFSNRFAQLLYQEIAEPDADRMRVIDADLERTAAEFHSSVASASAEESECGPEDPRGHSSLRPRGCRLWPNSSCGLERRQ